MSSNENQVQLVFNLPKWLYRILRAIKLMMFSLKKQEVQQVKRNIVGDRDIEWSWVLSQMPSGPGEALDFGPGESSMGLTAVLRGYNVTAVDLTTSPRYYIHPRLRFIQGDLLKLALPKEHFDLVINCSVVEHVGLAGRYGVRESCTDGDLEVMGRLREMMKPGGIMLLTIPVGQDAVFLPLHRIYGEQRLPILLNGYITEKENFWIKDDQNRWVECDKKTALNSIASAGSWDPMQNIYALGCFVLLRG